MEAAQLDVKKIAFPALGTGELNFNIDDAADALFAGIERFRRKRPQSSLTKVLVVIYKSSHLSAYRQALDKRLMKIDLYSFSSSGEYLEAADQAILSNGCKFTIDCDDITKIQSEAIIATEGVVWEEVKKANPLLKADWEKRKQRLGTTPIEIPSSQLNPCHIFLIAPQKCDESSSHAANIQKIAPLVADCLIKADQKGLLSIALPAIGTSRLLFSNRLSCEAIIHGAKAFAANVSKPSLNNIKLIVFESGRLNDFEKELQQQFAPLSQEGCFDANNSLEGCFDTSNSLPSYFLNSFSPKPVKEIAAAEPKVVHATVIGATTNACSSAVKRLKEAMDKECISQKVKMELPNDIKEDELTAIAEEFDVGLVVKPSDEKPEIYLNGMRRDVFNAFEKVTTRLGDLLKEEKFKTEVTFLAEKVGWKWDDFKGKSELFSPEENMKLEFAYCNDKQKMHDLQLQGEKVTVDFTKMTLQNVRTKEMKKIGRRDFSVSGI